MKAKTYFPRLLPASGLLVLLAGLCWARGNDASVSKTQLGENLTDHTQFFEAAENTVALNVTHQTATTFTTDQGAAFDATKRQLASFLAYLRDADAETRNESSSLCEKARLCNSNRLLRSLRCSCHSHCHLFGDCCEDALQSSSTKIAGHLPRTAYSCYSCNSSFAKAINIITSCPKDYEIEIVVKACNLSRHFMEHNSSLDSLSTPVTDGTTGLTYGNLFCAIYWDANQGTSEPWLWNFHCNNDKIGGETKMNIAVPAIKNRGNYSEELHGISTLTFLRTTCKFSFVPPRKFSAPFTECDPTEISTCPSQFDLSHDLVTRCSSPPFRRVYYNQVAYRNVYCLMCNHVGHQVLPWSCLPPPGNRSIKWNRAILVTPSREYCDVNSRFSKLTMKTDDFCGRLASCLTQDRQSIKCTGVCPSPMHNQVGQCRPLNATTLCSFDEVHDDSSFSCSYWPLFASDHLVVQVNATATMCYSCVFESFASYSVVNGSFLVTLNGSSRFYSNVLTYVKEGLLNVLTFSPPVSTLSPMENDGTYCASSTLHWGFPLTGLLISQCSLLAYFALYAVSPQLRSFGGEIVFNQSLAFFFGGTFFTLRWITDYTPTECRPLVILVLYFYNAAFTWSSLFAIDVARALSNVISVTQQNGIDRRRVAHYLIGWGSSLVVILVGVAADELVLEIRPSFGTWLCWYGDWRGMFVFAVGPLGVCLTIDVFAYIYVIVRLAVLERQTRTARKTRRQKLLLAVKLLIAIGLQWVSVIAAAIASNDWSACAYKMTGSLQGTFILLIFAFKRDVLVSLKCCLPPQMNRIDQQSSTSAVTIDGTLQLPAQALVPGTP